MQLSALEQELHDAGIHVSLESDIPERVRLHELLKRLEEGVEDDKEYAMLLKEIKSAEAQYALAFHHWIAREYPHLLFERSEDKTYWLYNDESGLYVECNASYVRGVVMNELNKEGLTKYMTSSFVKDCLCRYRGIYSDRGKEYEDFDNEDTHFHVANGWVQLSDVSFSEHTPDRLSRIKSAVEYIEGATCPTYDKFVDEDIRVKSDVVRVLDQFSGLLLTHENKYQQMLTIVGKPGCGKSTLLEAWTHVLGDLVAQSSLSDFMGDKHRFMGSTLAGRTLCWFDEVDVKRNEMGSVLERKITSNKFEIERKGIDGTRYVDNHLKFVLTANNLPMSVEDGMYRRLLIINFGRSFTDDGSVDRDMPKKIMQEAPGILNRMLRGLADLQKMNGFTVIEGHDEMIEDYKASSNTLAEFLDTYFEPTTDKSNVIATELLFKAYIGFCGNGKTFGLTPKRFGRLLGSQPLHKFSNIENDKKCGIRGWKGLVLKDEYTFDEDMVMPIKAKFKETW